MAAPCVQSDLTFSRLRYAFFYGTEYRDLLWVLAGKFFFSECAPGDSRQGGNLPCLGPVVHVEYIRVTFNREEGTLTTQGEFRPKHIYPGGKGIKISKSPAGKIRVIMLPACFQAENATGEGELTGNCRGINYWSTFYPISVAANTPRQMLPVGHFEPQHPDSQSGSSLQSIAN